MGNPEDELGQMARVLNHLLDRLEAAFQQLQRFTADAAHELRTPLATMPSTGELALRDETASVEQCRDATGSILEECTTLSQTIDDLLTLARAEAVQPGKGQTTFSLFELTGEVLSVLEILSEEKGMQLLQTVEDPERAVVHAERGLVRTALINLVHNALKFLPPHSTVRIRLGLAGEEAGVAGL